MVASRVVLPGLILVILLIVSVTSHERCETPNWPAELGEDDLFEAYRGKVLLVALMKGYCGYCVVQARGLQYLKNHLASQGLTDIEVLIVNGGEPISRDNIHNLQEAVSLPIIQDTEDHVMFNDVIGGNKDDFVVYDKCGQRAFYIPTPYSYLGHNITVRVLQVTYRNLHRCPCSVGSPVLNVHDRMMGDQPLGGPVNGVRMDTTEFSCPANDYWCRKYSRFLRHGQMGTAMSQSEMDSARNLNRPRFTTLHESLEPARGGQRGHRSNHRGHNHRGRHHRGHNHRGRHICRLSSTLHGFGVDWSGMMGGVE